MKEPERNESDAMDGDVAAARTSPDEPFTIEPKAYAFDGWSMVPLEIESV